MTKKQAKKKPTLLTIPQYANHRNVDQNAVRYAIKKEKLHSSVTQRDGAVLIDRDKADKEWIPRFNPRDEKSQVEAKDQVSKKKSKKEKPTLDGIDISELVPVQISRMKREMYEAELSKIKVEKERGKLVDAKEVEKLWVQISSTTRTKVLGIPTKVRQLASEITDSQFEIIKRVVRETLEDISRGDASD